MTEIDCILSCPEHGPQFRIECAPTGREGVYIHTPIRISDDEPVERAKACVECGGALTREDPKNAA